MPQSKDGVWTETLEEGDVDHERLVRGLALLRLQPQIVLEPVRRRWR